MVQSNCNRRNREKHKQLGLCIDCSDKVEVGRLYCLRHLEQRKKRNRRYKLLSKELYSERR